MLPHRTHFLELDDADLAGLADGLSRVLAGYDDLGLSTFNFALYSGELGVKTDAFRCCLRIVSRMPSVAFHHHRFKSYTSRISTLRARVLAAVSAGGNAAMAADQPPAPNSAQ